MRIPAIVLLPESAEAPEEIVLDSFALRLAIVQKGQHNKVSSHFERHGFYMLFSRLPNLRYSVYTGKAGLQPVKGRISQHQSKRDYDVAVMVVRDTTHGFNSAQVGWLEGRFVELFKNLPWAEVKNGPQPSDETLPAFEQEILNGFVDPICRVLDMLDLRGFTRSLVLVRPGRRELAGKRQDLWE